jgi:exonuclease III
MIRFCGSKMCTIFFLFLSCICRLVLSPCLVSSMNEVQIDLPLDNVVFNGNKLFPDISISAVNCNSFNMGTVTKHARLRKFYGIVSLKTDIILLSDIRMCNKNGLTDSKFINETFAINPYCSYRFIHQSVKNSRGVGILIKKSLMFDLLDSDGDPGDNFLVVKARINNKTVILVSIYGPNNKDDDFFARLLTSIRNAGDFPVVIGGDWNTTYSSLPLPGNPDVLNMNSVPNIANSKKIKELR